MTRLRLICVDQKEHPHTIELQSDLPREIWSNPLQTFLSSMLAAQGYEIVSVQRVIEHTEEVLIDSIEAGVVGGRAALSALKTLTQAPITPAEINVIPILRHLK